MFGEQFRCIPPDDQEEKQGEQEEPTDHKRQRQMEYGSPWHCVGLSLAFNFFAPRALLALFSSREYTAAFLLELNDTVSNIHHRYP